MFDDIQEKRNSLATYILVGCAGVGMLFIGVPFFSLSGGGNSEVARVNGEAITVQDFRIAATQNGDKLSQRDLLSRLINSRLMGDAALNAGYRLPEKKLYELIKARFGDDKTYRDYLVRMGISAQAYQTLVAREVGGQNYLNMLQLAQFPVPSVNAQLLQNRLAERDVRIVTLPLAPALKPVAEPALQAYYQAHIQEYATPPEVAIDFILFKRESLENPKAISAQELADYRAKLEKEAQRGGRYFIFDDAKSAEAAWAQLQKGETPAALAAAIQSKKISGDTGELELHAKGQGASAAIDEALFALPKVGAYSPVFKTQYGEAIVVYQTRKSAADGQSDADLRRQLAQQKADRRYRDLSNQAYDASQSGAKIEDIAHLLQTSVKDSGFFAANPWNNAELKRQLFGKEALKVGAVGQPIALNDGESLFFSLKARREATRVPLAKIKDKVAADAARAAAETRLSAQAKTLLASWQKGKLPELAPYQGQSAQLLKVNQPAALKAYPPAVIKAVLEGQKTWSHVQGPNAQYLIHLEALHLPDLKKLPETIRVEWGELWQALTQAASLQGLSAYLQERGKISINPNFLK